MNNQIHSQGSQRLSTSVSLYFFYCHFQFIVKPTLVNLLLLFFLNAYLLTFPEVEPPVQDISPQAEFRIFSFSWRNKTFTRRTSALELLQSCQLFLPIMDYLLWVSSYFVVIFHSTQDHSISIRNMWPSSEKNPERYYVQGVFSLVLPSMLVY